METQIKEKSIEDLKVELLELEKQYKEKYNHMNEVLERLESSKQVKDINGKRKELDNKRIKLRQKEKDLCLEIKQKYYDASSSNSLPSWSQTYGHNIYDEVISAIKKTFDWSKLSGSTIECITQKLIQKHISGDGKIIALRTQIEEINDEDNKLYNEYKKLTCENEEYIKLYKETNLLDDEIIHLKGEIASISIVQGKGTKDDVQDSWIKKRALQKYRELCESNYEKVIPNLKVDDEERL